MQVGDKFLFTPSTFGVEGASDLPKETRKKPVLTGRVEYIHPQRRYFIVAAEVYGHTIRETFYFKPSK